MPGPAATLPATRTAERGYHRWLLVRRASAKLTDFLTSPVLLPLDAKGATLPAMIGKALRVQASRSPHPPTSQRPLRVDRGTCRPANKIGWPWTQAGRRTTAPNAPITMFNLPSL
jgi:hypothetical protein